MLRMMASLEFTYLGLRFVPLVECDLDRIAPAFACPDIMRLWARTGAVSPRDYLEEKWKHDVDGDSLTLIAFEGEEPVAVAGLNRREEGLSSSTYIVPAARGRGVNLKLKAVQVHLAKLAGLQLLARVSEWNERSRRAVLKLWPGASWVPYTAAPPLFTEGQMYFLNGAPQGAEPLTVDAEAAELRVLECSALGRSLVAKAAQTSDRADSQLDAV